MARAASWSDGYARGEDGRTGTGWVVLWARVTGDHGPVKKLHVGTRYTYNIQFYPNGHSIQMPPTPGSVPRVAFDFRELTAWAALEYYGGLLGWNYCTAFRARRVRLSSGRSAIDLGPDCEIFSLGFRPRVTGRHSFTVQMYQVEVQGGRYRVVGAPRGGVAGWQGLIEP